jgi:NADH-quinone oxidoreductase subunit A
MTALVGYLVLFLVVGVGFILAHLLAGKLIRPAKPDPEKLTIYECGEPTIGTAWVQFDLRFYVIALLFVVFDVEVAFFFPWAVVFGEANAVANPQLPVERQVAAFDALVPDYPEHHDARQQVRDQLAAGDAASAREVRQAAGQLGWLAFWDILVFFGVLLVGFAYLWKRGDLVWVRSTLAERTAAVVPEPMTTAPAGEELAGAAR